MIPLILQLGLHILPRLKLTVSSLRHHPAACFFIQAATMVAASIVGYAVSSPLHVISVMVGKRCDHPTKPLWILGVQTVSAKSASDGRACLWVKA